VEFEWDDAKHAKNLRERSIGSMTALESSEDRSRFGGTCVGAMGELRFRAIGESEGGILHVSFT
jgi:uncharacterized DUF497 family protein